VLLAYATGTPLPGLPAECSCRAKLTLDHMMSCGPTKLLRHNMLQARLVAFAREHAVATQQNPRLSIEDAKELQEPDIIFYPGVAKPIETDVTVANACCPSKVAQTARCAQWPVKEARAGKKRKYLEQARLRGNTFDPLVFTTHGDMGEEVRKLLRTLASNVDASQGRAVAGMELDLAVTLVRGNVRCVRQTVARAYRHQDMQRARLAQAPPV
jgi:hypothetical protein